MKITLRHILFSSLCLVMVLALACTNEAADSTPASGTSSSAPASSGGGASPTPIPVSTDVVTEFVEAQQAISQDWDSFHVDLDRWRAGLQACDRTAVESALRIFASDFGKITMQARNLPGKGIARELPTEVIAAATNEEASLRSLRDNWNPANTVLLESSQNIRAESADMVRMTQIAVDQLEEMDDPEDREIAKEFASNLAPVEAAWDDFYDSYDALEDEHLELDATEIVTRLRSLVDEHEVVVEALEELPADKVTDPVQDPLIEAADAEAEALGDLLDAMRRAARSEASEAEPEAETAAAENGEETAEPNGPEGAMTGPEEAGANGEGEANGGNGAPQGSAEGDHQGALPHALAGSEAAPNDHAGAGGEIGLPAATSMPGDPDPQGFPQESGEAEGNGGPPPDYSEHFDAFDETLDSTRAVRRNALRDLEDLVEGFSENDREALAEFVAAFGKLMGSWDSFHTDFDAWVRTEGDCNRANVIAALQQYNQRFSEIGSRVRGLSQASYLRPSSDLISEAADREGSALRSLTNTWAPYESDVYRGLDEERSNADKLRRLANRRVQELIERNGISLSQ